MSSEKFNLRWNDFHSNVTQSFGLLRNEEYLQDVTLVTDDHIQISAHKLVLSSCSEYFKSIFKKNKSSNLLLCLEGVSREDLDNCLNYMYNGEVQIFQDDLDKFLNVAQRFQLNGLLGQEKNEVLENEILITDEDLKAEPLDVVGRKNEKEIPSKRKSENRTKSIALNDTFGGIIGYQTDTDQYIETKEDGWICTICGRKVESSRRDMKNHVEIHIEGLSYPCQLCERTFKSKNLYKVHKSKVHRRK